MNALALSIEEVLGLIRKTFRDFSFFANTVDVLVDFGVVVMSKVIFELGFIVYTSIGDVIL